MAHNSEDDQYSEQETVARREAALKRMLSTPHQPHKPLGKKRKEQADGKRKPNAPKRRA